MMYLNCLKMVTLCDSIDCMFITSLLFLTFALLSEHPINMNYLKAASYICLSVCMLFCVLYWLFPIPHQYFIFNEFDKTEQSKFIHIMVEFCFAFVVILENGSNSELKIRHVSFRSEFNSGSCYCAWGREIWTV